jgi:DNA-binding transcriptional ArsR family regulator
MAAGVYKKMLVQGKSCAGVHVRYHPQMTTQPAFAAVADPRRREMLLLVRDQPRSVNEIAEHFDVTQQAVSQHLQVLLDAELVDVRPEGQRRLYVIRPDGLASLESFLAELWPAGLGRLKRAVEEANGQ